jgi:hypothetical protein
MTSTVYASEKERFQASSSAAEPTVKPPPWRVNIVGSSAGDVRSWWVGKKILGESVAVLKSIH